MSNLTAGWATVLTVTDSAVQKLWITTERGAIQDAGGIIMPDALLEPDPADFQTVTLAVALDPAAGSADSGDGGGGFSGERNSPASTGRIIVVGDVDFLQEQFLRSNQQNLIFTLNAVDWLAQDEALIGIRSKLRTPPVMAFTSEFQRVEPC